MSLIEALPSSTRRGGTLADDFTFHNTASYLVLRQKLGGDYAGLPLPVFDNGGPGDVVKWEQFTESRNCPAGAERKARPDITPYVSFEHPVGPQIGSSCVLCTEDHAAVGLCHVDDRRDAAVAGGLMARASMTCPASPTCWTASSSPAVIATTWDYRSDYSIRYTANGNLDAAGLRRLPCAVLDHQAWTTRSTRRRWPICHGGAATSRAASTPVTADPARFEFKPEIVKVSSLG